jgi:hypothetical protein
LRKQIIAEQSAQGNHTMCIDASCWKYLDNNGTYLRYSLDGPFYDRAEYANKNSNNGKWQEISSSLGIQLKPPQHNNGHILIGMQRDGGFAMKTLDPMSWLWDKIQAIRKVTGRPIHIRPHPGKYNMADFAKYTGRHARRLSTVVIHPEQSRLIDNLQGAHSAVFFNSSASVAAVCRRQDGAPGDTTDVAHTCGQLRQARQYALVHERTSRAAAWRRWAQQAVQGHARAAHRWIKRLDLPPAGLVRAAGTDAATTDPRFHLQAHSDNWDALWNPPQPPPPPAVTCEGVQLPAHVRPISG